MSYSWQKAESVCCEHCFRSNSYWPADLNSGNRHWISDCIHAVMYCGILNQIVNWFVSLYMSEINFSLINETGAQLAPYCYDALRSSHKHQLARKCTWIWPVGTEMASCFSKNDVASDDTALHNSNFLTLLHPLGAQKYDFSAQMCLLHAF